MEMTPLLRSIVTLNFPLLDGVRMHFPARKETILEDEDTPPEDGNNDCIIIKLNNSYFIN